MHHRANEQFNNFAITDGLKNEGQRERSSKGRFALGCSALVESFAERTTSHGLPHMHHARGPIKKIWWALVTVGAIAGLSYNLYTLVTNFMSYPVNVNINIVHQPELAFPSVTICNMSPVKRSLWQKKFSSATTASAAAAGRTMTTASQQGHGRRRKRDVGGSTSNSTTDKCCCSCCFSSSMVGQESACPCGLSGGFSYDATTCTEPSRVTADVTSTVTMTTSATLTSTLSTMSSSPMVSTEFPSSPLTTDFMTSTAAVDASTATSQQGVTTGETTQRSPMTTTGSQSFTSADNGQAMVDSDWLNEQLATMSLEDRVALGFSLDDLVLDCRFAGSECDFTNFAPFYNDILGNCYIFNSGWNSTDLKTSSRTGPRFGLQLILNVDQDEYMAQGDDAAGMRLVVHEPLRMPFPEDEGLAINPGQTTSIGLQRTNITRLPAPFGACENPKQSNDTLNLYKDLYPSVLYSTLACMRSCYQQNVAGQCGCGDPSYPLSGTTLGTLTPCQSSLEQICMSNVTTLYNQNQLNCSCPDSCSDISYSTEISIGLWPSLVQKADIVAQLQGKVNYTLDDTAIQNNLCKVQVFYEQFDYESIEESQAYPVTQFLSDTGGVLGLWLGMSLLTVFEMFEFLLDIGILGVANIYVSSVQYRRRKAAGRTNVVHPSAATTTQPTDRSLSQQSLVVEDAF